MARITKKLSLDSKAAERGERYSKLHSTSLSQLVNDFLLHLPVDQDEPDLTPTVRRLLGAAKGGPGENEYYDYLIRKFGAQPSADSDESEPA